MTRRVSLYRWDELPLDKVTEMVARKVIAGERQTLVQVYLKKGALVPQHAHASEQMIYVLQGALRALVDGEELDRARGRGAAGRRPAPRTRPKRSTTRSCSTSRGTDQEAAWLACGCWSRSSIVVGPVARSGCTTGSSALKNQTQNGWRQIDVQLKRRHDLIPNLVNTVKGAMEFEKGHAHGGDGGAREGDGARPVRPTRAARKAS